MIAPAPAASAPLAARDWLLIVALAGSAVALLPVADGNAAVAAVPVLAVALAWCAWNAPAWKTLSLLMFLTLVFEGPVRKDTPVFGSLLDMGCQILLMNLNIITGIRPLAFTAVDAVSVFLLAVLVHQAAWAHQRGRVRSPAPLVKCGTITLVSTVGLFALGVARAGDFRNSLWQVHVLLFVPVLFLLFEAALRGVEDARPLGRLVLAAAVFRAGVVLLIAYGLDTPIRNAATSHSDSVLFTVACAIVISRAFEEPTRRNLGRCALFLPVLFLAMVENNRRLVWVELAGVLIIIFYMSRWSALKRAIARAVVLSAPLILLYVAAGWNSSAPAFAPVRILSSMLDAKPDASTVMRDIENYNLLKTLRSAPLLGIGWGHPYLEFIRAIDISNIFPQYRYLPHNGVLGLWAFNGVIGFFLLFLLPVVGIYFAARAHRHARRPEERVLAVCVVCTLATHLLQCFGDIGIASWTSVFLVGPALALAGKLAVTTGAWPSPGAAHLQRNGEVAA